MIQRGKKKTWSKISFRRELAHTINDFLNTSESKKMGFTNLTQFINAAAKEKLDKLVNKQITNFSYHGQSIRLVDNNASKGNTILEVFIKKNGLLCSRCESRKCVHIIECLKEKEIISKLKDQGIIE